MMRTSISLKFVWKNTKWLFKTCFVVTFFISAMKLTSVQLPQASVPFNVDLFL